MNSDKSISCANDDMGNVTSINNTNPILDTLVYNVIFPDVSLQHYSEHFNSKNICLQVDA